MSVTDQEMPAVPANEAAGEAAMRDWAELLVERARSEGVELTGDRGLLTGLGGRGVGARRSCDRGDVVASVAGGVAEVLELRAGEVAVVAAGAGRGAVVDVDEGKRVAVEEVGPGHGDIDGAVGPHGRAVAGGTIWAGGRGLGGGLTRLFRE